MIWGASLAQKKSFKKLKFALFLPLTTLYGNAVAELGMISPI
jgi:hypothetical protein